MGQASDPGPSARIREQQIRSCALPRHLKETLFAMWRYGDWARGDRIRVSNGRLASDLSMKATRGVQLNIGALIAMGILEVEGPLVETRRRDGTVVRSARRGGRGRPNEYRIAWDALPAAIASEVKGRTPDHPSLFNSAAPKDDLGNAEGRTTDHPLRPKDDPEITRSSFSDRPNDRQRTTAADAAAYQPALFIEEVAPMDRGGVRLSAARKRELATEPNVDNAKTVKRLAFELLDHPEEAARLLGFEAPIVWVHDRTNVAATCEAQGNLIEAVKRRCAQLGIDYGRDDRVPFDVVHRQVQSAWTYRFVIQAGAERPRGEVRRARQTS